MAEERIIGMSVAEIVSDDDFLPVDSPTLGTRRAPPRAIFAKGALSLDPFDPGVYLGVQVVASFNGEIGTVPMSDASGGFVGVLQAQLQQSIAGLSADAQGYANASQASADLALQRANALPGVVLADGSQSARSWQDAAQRTALTSPVLAIRRHPDADFVTNAAGEKVYTLQATDLFCMAIFANTVAGFLDCPPQLFTGNAPDGTEGAAWVHAVRGNAALTIRAQPAPGGPGGGPVTPVGFVGRKPYSGKITSLPANNLEPAQVLNYPSVPAGSDRRVVVAAGAIYNRANAVDRAVSCSGTFGPTAAAKVAVPFTKIAAETSTGWFSAGDDDPVCVVVFEATLPDTTNVQDLAVTLDFGGAAHTDITWCWAAELSIAKAVGSRAVIVALSDGGALATADVVNSWNQPVNGLALYGAWGQNAAAAPVSLATGSAGAVDDTGKTAGATTNKDIAYLFGHAVTSGAAQSATAHFSLAAEWGRYLVVYLPKAAQVIVGNSSVTLLQAPGLLSAQYKHAYVYALTDGFTYHAAGT